MAVHNSVATITKDATDLVNSGILTQQQADNIIAKAVELNAAPATPTTTPPPADSVVNGDGGGNVPAEELPGAGGRPAPKFKVGDSTSQGTVYSVVWNPRWNEWQVNTNTGAGQTEAFRERNVRAGSPGGFRDISDFSQAFGFDRPLGVANQGDGNQVDRFFSGGGAGGEDGQQGNPITSAIVAQIQTLVTGMSAPGITSEQSQAIALQISSLTGTLNVLGSMDASTQQGLLAQQELANFLIPGLGIDLLNVQGDQLRDQLQFGQGGTVRRGQDITQQNNLLSQLLGQGQLNLDAILGGGNLQLGQGQLDLDTLLGQGQLGLGQGRLDLDTLLGLGDLGLGQGRLDLDTLLGEGNLDLGQGQLDLQRLLGEGGLDLERLLGMEGLDIQRLGLENDLIAQQLQNPFASFAASELGLPLGRSLFSQGPGSIANVNSLADPTAASAPAAALIGGSKGSSSGTDQAFITPQEDLVPGGSLNPTNGRTGGQVPIATTGNTDLLGPGSSLPTNRTLPQIQGSAAGRPRSIVDLIPSVGDLGFNIPRTGGGARDFGSLFAGGTPPVGALNQTSPEGRSLIRATGEFTGTAGGEQDLQSRAITPGVARAPVQRGTGRRRRDRV